MPIVTTEGFRPAEPISYRAYGPDSALPEGAGLAVDLPNDADPADLLPRLADIAYIRIPFPTYGDGRGFSLARALRDIGYAGHLRAYGYLISDQYPHVLGSGFDDVEISDELAARQPEEQWRAQALPGYRAKLAGAA